jgi:NlpC/P60 family putative phage cell wall peptidase
MLTFRTHMTREYVVSVARKWLGTPYHHQASIRGVGCDCLGLLRGVYREVMGSEPEAPPPYSADWAEALGREILIEAVARYMEKIELVDAREGDTLIFRMADGVIAKHCGILTGPDTMIDSVEGVGVCETHLNMRWVRRVAAVFRFPGIDE